MSTTKSTTTDNDNDDDNQGEGEAIGGIWSNTNQSYINSTLQVPYWHYEFVDYPWPKHLIVKDQINPTRETIQKYCIYMQNTMVYQIKYNMV